MEHNRSWQSLHAWHSDTQLTVWSITDWTIQCVAMLLATISIASSMMTIKVVWSLQNAPEAIRILLGNKPEFTTAINVCDVDNDWLPLHYFQWTLLHTWAWARLLLLYGSGSVSRTGTSRIILANSRSAQSHQWKMPILLQRNIVLSGSQACQELCLLQ